MSSVSHKDLGCKRYSWPRRRLRPVKARLPWTPRWRVFRMTDACPGENFGSFTIPNGLEAGAAVRLCKARCEAGQDAPSGFVLAASHQSRSGSVYFRPPAAQLVKAKIPLMGAWLCVEVTGAPKRPSDSSCRSVVVITSQDEFDETCYTDPAVDVSTSGNGRKLATHAMLRCLLEESLKGSLTVAILVIDVQAPTVSGGSTLRCQSALRCEGPEIMQVYIQNFGAVEVCRGDFEQLLVAGACDLEVDLAISTSVRRDMLTLLHAVRSARFVAMSHDYNIPYGPWGVREAGHESHLQLLERTLLLCTSRHLAAYLTHWSGGKASTRLCYCADYGYFDRYLNAEESQGRFVTFISPCPAKGLCIFLRVARSLPSVRFLAVTTLWTKSIHQKALQELPNVEIWPGRNAVEEIYKRTAVLLVPSIWSEAFGLVAVEAQLHGIPVVSSDHYGLKEANMCEDLRVQVELVQDMRIRTLHRGQTIDALEKTLPHSREEPRGTEEEVMRKVAQTHLYVASPEEAHGFTERVQRLMNDKTWRKLKGNEARRRAESFVQSRRGFFQDFLAETWRHVS